MPETTLNDEELNNIRKDVLRWIEKNDKESQKKSAKSKVALKNKAIFNVNKNTSIRNKSIESDKKEEFKRINDGSTDIFKKTAEIKIKAKIQSKNPENFTELNRITPPITARQTFNESNRKAKACKNQLPAVKKPKKKKKSLKIIIVPFLGITFIFLFFCLGIYYFNWNSQNILNITRIIPFPAISVNGYTISYFKYLKNYNALIKIYNQQKQPVNFLKNDIKNRTLNKLIENEIIRQIAATNNVTISEQELKSELIKITDNKKINLSEITENLYDWNINEFVNFVLKPYLFRQKLIAFLENSEPYQSQARAKTEKILQDIKSGAISFEDAAIKYSDSINNVIGGDLGYLDKKDISNDFNVIALALNPGEVSEVYKINNSYQIIRIDEIIKDNMDNVVKIKARNILIKPEIMFENIVNQKIDQAVIWKFIR